MKILFILFMLTASQFSLAQIDRKGNGGNLSDIPVTQYQIYSELLHSRNALMYITNFLDRKQITVNPVSKDFEAFRQAIRDHDMLADTYPCYESSGAQVDASTASRAPGKICVNVDSLAKKLTVSDYRWQILGLIAHEYSHFVGATESEAADFQKRIILLVQSTDVMGEITLRNIEMQRAENTINTVLSFPKLTDLTVYLALREAGASLFRVYMGEVVSEGSNLLQNQDRAQIAEILIQLKNWESSLCERSLRVAAAADCKYYLDNIYQGLSKAPIQRFAKFSQIGVEGAQDVAQSYIQLRRQDKLPIIIRELKTLALKINGISEKSYPHVGLP
jgi:hypothetical protein